ncbi:MAG: 4Fe-4S dicluster domain-containing protein [Candidatus Hydrogenedentota bacterium]|nr:MAG: 4Fe-4S dicluster domain-containing protein [Candidatus Hydrogenedentota bacterium]
MKDSVYTEIAQALKMNPLGIPMTGGEISQAFIDFLKLIYTHEEAEVVKHLNVYPMFKTAHDVAAESGRDIDEIRVILNGCHARYSLMGVGDNHALPTIFYIFNFHNRYPQIKPGDLEAARLYKQFFIDEGFYKQYENSKAGTPVFRAIPVEQSIESNQEVLTSEEAHGRIDNLQTDFIALVPCPCRTRMEKLGTRECKDKFPIGACVIPGDNGRKFVDLGMGKQATKEQAKKYIDEMQDVGLVVNSDNALSPDPIVICLCCGCCCSQMRGRTKWDNPKAILASNFVPRASDDCIMCGTCVDRCALQALSIDDDAGRAVVDPDKCIGCGVCTLTCPQETLKLYRLERSKPFETTFDLGMTLYTENHGDF